MALTVLSRWHCASTCILLLSSASAVLGQADVASVPPEVRKTVDAFLGHWSLSGTFNERISAAPSRVTGTMDCELTVGGIAVRCRVTKVDSGGAQIEIATIAGYSPDDNRVHLMEAATPGLYHQHAGRWKGSVIQFDRLTKSVGGKRIVEDFAIGFPSLGRMTISATEYDGRDRSTLRLVGTRVVGVK